jgi:hypothetical protein
LCFYALLNRFVSGDYQEDDRGRGDHDDEDSFPTGQGGSSSCTHVDDQGRGIEEDMAGLYADV